MLLFQLLLLAVGFAAEWSVQKANLETIILGVSFVNSTTGYLPGEQNGVGILFLKTDDGGDSWAKVDSVGFEMIVMGIAMAKTSSGAVQGVIGGMGGPANSGLFYTLDGVTFQQPTEPPFFGSISQDVDVVKGVDSSFALVGGFEPAPQQILNGAAITTDGGETWKAFDMGIGSSAPARYGAFPSADVWYITAGIWPADSADLGDAQPLSQKLRRVDGKLMYISPEKRGSSPRRSMQQDDGYICNLMKTTDGGQTWSTQYTSTSFYPNGISCPTTTDCWAVAEAEDDSSTPGVFILHTSDGTNWDIQYSIADGHDSLMDVQMVNTTHGTACGAKGYNSLFLLTTDGGQTWTEQAQELQGTFCTALDLLPPTTAGDDYLGWGTAISLAGESSVLVYN